MLFTPGELLISSLSYYGKAIVFLSLGSLTFLMAHNVFNLVFSHWYASLGITLLAYLGLAQSHLTKNRLKDVLNPQHLSNRVTLSRSDNEFNTIADHINTLTRTLTSKEELLKSCAMEASFTAKELLKSSNEVAEGAMRESQALDQLASTSEEMSTTINDVSMRLDTTTGMASQTLSRSQQGATALKDLADKIDSMNHTVSVNQTQIETLSVAAQNIAEFVTRIGDITEQINLLSLNAAIESARAGEAGRGFAVVANEVRTLAANTETVTNDIAQLVKSMTEQVDSSNRNSGSLISQAQQATSSLTQVQDLLADIRLAAEKTQSDMQLSQTTIHDFQAANDDLCRRLQDIAQVSDKQTQNSQSTKDMVRYLEWLATRLAPQEV
ncbi:methyl-accepting chemotaxis protein [Marinomonas communis]|uniref:methyl-accepting chemotaxis protein n=1 Tax=Marinomonas communis TaxID=28254 RepID=UPI001D18CBC2|nr:methyl-accepting chemotaxis protein [Marinomonas communis]MCC4275090.1 methyl-accepting chemotaxis protein [Marinomonas communis]